MGVALLNTRAGDVVELGKSRKIFPGKIMWNTVVVVILNNRIVVEESGESQRNVFGTFLFGNFRDTARFETSADTVTRNHVVGKVRGDRASV